MRLSFRVPAAAMLVMLAVDQNAAQSQTTTVPPPACTSSNPLVGVGASLLYPGLGHIYVGGGEHRRGRVLAGTATAGLGLMLVSLFAYAATHSDDVVDAGVWTGTGVYVLAGAFAIGDIVPAIIRERRRCGSGDKRVGLRLMPARDARTPNGRPMWTTRMLLSVTF